MSNVTLHHYYFNILLLNFCYVFFCIIIVMNPIEVVKTRLQLQGEMQEERQQSTTARLYGKERKYKGMFRGGIEILKDEGIRGLYKG